MIEIFIYVAKLSILISLFFVLNWISTLSVTIGYILTKWVLFRYILGLQLADHMTGTFMENVKNNSSYIMGMIIVERGTIKDCEAFFTKVVTLPNSDRMRMRLVNVLGEYYWKKEENFKVMNHILYSPVQHVESLEEVLEIMGKEMQTPIIRPISPWELYFIENFQSDKSAWYIKFQHGIADGVAFQYYVCHSSDVPPTIVQRFAPPSLCRDILIYALFPVLFPYALIKLSCTPHYEGVLSQKNKPLAGIKKIGVSPTFSVEMVKTAAKKYGVTINEFILAIVLANIKKFLKEKYNEVRESISMGIPYNLREDPGKGKHITLDNNFAVFYYSFPLVDIEDIDKDTTRAFEKIKRVTKDLKRTILPHSFKLLQTVIEGFPHTLARKIELGGGDIAPIIFTNVAGSKTQLIFGGKAVQDLVYLAPCLGNNCINICISTYNGRLNMIANSDINRLDNPKELIAMMSRMMDAYLRNTSIPSQQPILETESKEREDRLLK